MSFLFKNTFKTGVIVSDTNAEIKTAHATTIPNSRNKLPTKPCKKITGRNTTASVIEVDNTAKKISLLPSNAALRIGKPPSNFRKMFSVTTIPSSTTKPVASTIPNKVNTFIENPPMYMIKKVAINEMGISIKGLMAINQLRKKKKITITTKLKEIIKVSCTSSNDLRIFLVLSIKI